jgi:hypothetical protein
MDEFAEVAVVLTVRISGFAVVVTEDNEDTGNTMGNKEVADSPGPTSEN